MEKVFGRLKDTSEAGIIKEYNLCAGIVLAVMIVNMIIVGIVLAVRKTNLDETSIAFYLSIPLVSVCGMIIQNLQWNIGPLMSCSMGYPILTSLIQTWIFLAKNSDNNNDDSDTYDIYIVKH